jgi:hypothetical protein
VTAKALIVEVSLVDYNRNAPLIADVIAGARSGRVPLRRYL